MASTCPGNPEVARLRDERRGSPRGQQRNRDRDGAQDGQRNQSRPPHLFERNARVEAAGDGIVVEHVLGHLLRAEVAEDRGRADQAERAGILVLLRRRDGAQDGVLLRAGEAGEGSAVRGLRRSLDRIEPGDEEPPLVVGHELAVEAIEKRRDADVRGAGGVGARQDAIRGGAGDRGLRRSEVGPGRRGLRPAQRTSRAPARAPRRRGSPRAGWPRDG